MALFAFSCLVDVDPILTAQAFIWVKCLKRIQHVDPANIFVHVTVGRSQFCDWLKSEKVNIVEVERFDERNVYCNKIQQLASFCQTSYDQVVFMDCDTAWIGKERLPVGLPVSARIIDYANPPESLLLKIFSAAGLGSPYWWPVAFPHGRDRALTDVNNCNGGLYIFDREFLAKLAPRWRSWALWCLDNSQLFESFSVHADQVSFALAMRELDAKVGHLPLAWNYPTHIPVTDLPDTSPQIIHYHREMTGHLTLKTLGIPRVDHVITELNASIAGFIGEDLLNTVFWNFRYRIDPELGSGIGLRGADLDSKRRLIADALASFENSRIVDIGCGDLEATRHLSVKNYVGLDVAETAITIAREKRPDWTFQVMQTEDRIPEGDVVLCIDVLIHQPDERQFLDLIDRLAAAARRKLIVSGYDGPPTFTTEITRYYHPITAALRQTDAFTSVEILGRYWDVVVVAANKGDSATPAREVNAIGASTRVGKIVVGSGWWCDNSPHDWAVGSPATRSAAFFDLWYRQVLRCLRPDRIVITDSASPLKPDLGSYDRVQWIELDRNYGHPNDIRTGRIQTKYSGFTRSVINGAMYALCCDADFYVYVEQDCLLHGSDLLTHALGDSTADILLGAPTENGKGLNGATAAPMLQQCLIVVRRAGLERFLEGLLGAPWTDGERSPEEIMRLRLAPYDFLRVPYGRSRPIDFRRSHFYAQHLDDAELHRFRTLIAAPGTDAAVSAAVDARASGKTLSPCSRPKVSVLLLAYNQAPFIAQALDSALMQQTDFDVEIVAVDDASSDGTQDVIRDYADRHPHKIRPILHAANLGSETASFLATFRQTRGTYVALLDGDDYWTDPWKLQKQTDFLDANPDYTFCAHNNIMINTWTDSERLKLNLTEDRDVALETLIEGNPLHTSSVMYRNGLVTEWPQVFREFEFSDWPLELLLIQRGRARVLANVMSAYRIHSGGMWSRTYRERSASAGPNREAWGVIIKFWHAVDEHFEFKYNSYIERLIAGKRRELAAAKRDRVTA